MKLRVGVTGVGGGVGQSILKALSISSLPVETIAIDVTPASMGLWRVAERMVLPKLELPGSAEIWLKELLARRVQVIIPGSDHDVFSLAPLRETWLAHGLQALISDPDLVRTCRDKARTCARLIELGLPAPKSVCDLSTADALRWARTQEYPVMLKPRDGYASRNVHRINDEEELRFYYPRTPNPLLQEYLSNNGVEEEYTCAVFTLSNGQPLGTFMAKRDLAGGATYRAEVNVWPEVHQLLMRIAGCLKPRGPLNVQLRRTPTGYVPFELNIRCSGTSALRAHFGFNEPEMMLRHYVLKEDLAPPKPKTGFVLRYWNEMFLPDMRRESLTQHLSGGIVGTVRAWP